MNLKEEIGSILYDVVTIDGDRYDTVDHEGYTEDLLKLIKQWALEMVGEDSDQTDWSGKFLSETASITNKMKHEIKQRIEESVK